MLHHLRRRAFVGLPKLMRNEKKHILHKQREKRLIFKDDREVIEHSYYPAEYPGYVIPIPPLEVTNTRGRSFLGDFYKQFREFYNGHRNLLWFEKTDPANRLARGVWVAPSATVIGDVWLKDNVSVWYGAILRADKNEIEIDDNTNIQDGAIITTDDKMTESNTKGGVKIGANTIIGHGARLHACTIGHRCIIGIGAIVLEGVIVEDGCVIAAGSVVPPGRRIPAGEFWAGNPARYIRDLEKTEIDQIEVDAENYTNLAFHHDVEFTKTGLLYKEVDSIAQKLEKRAPPADERPMHWNVWKKMGGNSNVKLFSTKDRTYDD